MEEYICKNSKRQHPVTARQFDNFVEWQVKGRSGTISYSEIISVRLNRRGTKCTLAVLATGNRSFELSNRLYFADGTWEDQSHQYSTFVRILHFRIKEQSSISFKAGLSISHIAVWSSIVLLAGVAVHILAGVLGFSIPGRVILAIDTIFILTVLLVMLKTRPVAYFANELPIRYLPA